MPVAGFVLPRTRARIAPSAGCVGLPPLSTTLLSYPVITQCVPPPWPLFLWVNERTSAILSTTRAILGNVPPIETPGSEVGASPVTLRYSDGAPILGSNVSMCVGPPPSQSQTTDVSL